MQFPALRALLKTAIAFAALLVLSEPSFRRAGVAAVVCASRRRQRQNYRVDGIDRETNHLITCARNVDTVPPVPTLPSELASRSISLASSRHRR